MQTAKTRACYWFRKQGRCCFNCANGPPGQRRVDRFAGVQDANAPGGNSRARVLAWTTGRQVPFCLFTDPEFARIGLSETEAKERGIPYRLSKIAVETVLRARTLSETRGFMKALVETHTDRILGFTAVAIGAGEIIAAVQVAMLGGLPFTALRDAI